MKKSILPRVIRYSIAANETGDICSPWTLLVMGGGGERKKKMANFNLPAYCKFYIELVHRDSPAVHDIVSIVVQCRRHKTVNTSTNPTTLTSQHFYRFRVSLVRCSRHLAVISMNDQRHCRCRHHYCYSFDYYYYFSNGYSAQHCADVNYDAGAGADADVVAAVLCDDDPV